DGAGAQAEQGGVPRGPGGQQCRDVGPRNACGHARQRDPGEEDGDRRGDEHPTGRRGTGHGAPKPWSASTAPPSGPVTASTNARASPGSAAPSTTARG